jgi:hypothetical protein
MTILFSVAVFLSSFLLFWLELFFAKMLLPQFGGGAHIWTTCLAAFQILLLIGYGYAWAVARFRPILQVTIHIALMLLAVASLPLTMRSFELIDIPSLQILGVVVTSIGLPLVMLSTTSSVLQSWYARAFGQSPYWLYAMSNTGSLAALVMYPTLLEPQLSLSLQSTAWSGLFAIVAILTGYVIFLAYRQIQQATDRIDYRVQPEDSLVHRRTILLWLLFAFIPASLLSGITSYITAEIAPNPMVWSIFLGIYLVSLILVFLPEPILPPRAIGNTLILFIGCFLILELRNHTYFDRDNLVANIGFFSILCWLYHGWLVQLRPAPQRLGQFYFTIALGGAMGAVFNALVAPLILARLSEYHIILALSSPLILSVPDLKCAFQWMQRWLPHSLLSIGHRAILPATTIACVGIAMLYIHPAFSAPSNFTLERVARSFYSSYLVARNDQTRMLIHGRTLHGRESIDPNDRNPGSYYGANSPIADVLSQISPVGTVGAIGLGTGEMVAYAQPQQSWTFYEIDPLVVDIAQNNFSHLRQSSAKVNIVVGDARLQMAQVPTRYDRIVIDAFNSDAIPTHLLTLESLEQVWLTHLKQDGAIVYHITNTFLDLEPILARLAEATGLLARTRSIASLPDAKHMQSASQWVVLTQNPQLLARLGADWKPLRLGTTLWRDDFSSIRAAMRTRKPDFSHQN